MLHGWENFFIVGASAGATLIGLLFVAISLGAGLSTPQGLDATRAFLTPTLILFGGVLFECMAVLPPWPSAWPVGIILGLCGLTGLVLQIHVILKQRKVDFASLDWLDWTLFSARADARLLEPDRRRGRIDCRAIFRTLRHRGRDHGPAACRHLRRMVRHVVDRQEPGQDLAMRMPSANLLLSEDDPLRAETAPIGVTWQGPLTGRLATFAVAICNGSLTSTPAVWGAALGRFWR